MPFTTNGKRDYVREMAWEKTHKQGQRLRDRANRNAARRKMISLGKAKRNDGTNIDHVRALDSGGSGRNLKNLKVVSAKSNANKEVRRKRSQKGNN